MDLVSSCISTPHQVSSRRALMTMATLFLISTSLSMDGNGNATVRIYVGGLAQQLNSEIPK
jgi:hypothetical protein